MNERPTDEPSASPVHPTDEPDDESPDSGEEEEGEEVDEAPPPFVWKTWTNLHLAAVTSGWLALAVLVGGLIAYLDSWSSAPFVLLLYGAAASAVVATFAARRGGGGRGWLPRRLLGALVVLALLWAWFPPTLRLVGWVYRQVALYFLTM